MTSPIVRARSHSRRRTAAKASSLCCWTALLVAIACTSSAAEGDKRCSLWLDVYRGEPVSYEEILDDLAGVQAVYVGETHRLARHHEIQLRVFADLAKRGRTLALGLEQMESAHQAALDQYCRGQIDFERLASVTQWAKRWRNYEQYRPILEAARNSQSPILALNAKLETIRGIVRAGGVERLAPELRTQLPANLQLTDPAYEKFLGLQLPVHATANPQMLRPMIEAQIARDEAMAAALASFLQSEAGKGRTVVVLCGAGHVAYGLGTPARLRHRLPQIRDRILLVSESGDLELSPEERAMARPIQITHEQLRQIHQPVADYLHATSLKSATR